VLVNATGLKANVLKIRPPLCFFNDNADPSGANTPPGSGFLALQLFETRGAFRQVNPHAVSGSSAIARPYCIENRVVLIRHSSGVKSSLFD
jgi:hypothetical protein